MQLCSYHGPGSRQDSSSRFPWAAYHRLANDVPLNVLDVLEMQARRYVLDWSATRTELKLVRKIFPSS